MPPELRARASRLVERFHLDAGEWFRTSQPVPHLGSLSEAVWEARRIAITYDRDGIGVRRELEPLGLVLKAGIWYVVARIDEDQVRTYRVARVLAVEPLGGPFERPTAFDLAGYWAESAAAFERDVPRIEVVVRVRPDRLDHLRSAVGHGVVADAEYLADPDPDGWLRLRLRLDWPEEAPRRLLAAGGWVEVLEPAEVRARLAGTARAIAARYAADGG